MKFFWLAAFAASTLPAQLSEMVVHGRTIDENEAPIAAVEVTVRNAAGMEWHATTDPAGKFSVHYLRRD